MPGFELSDYDADELIALAEIAINENRLDEAVIQLKLALHDENPPTMAHAHLARVYAKLQLFDRAEQHFETFLTASPLNLTEQFQYGLVKFDQQKFDEAEQVWQRIVRFVPDHSPSLYYLAVIDWQRQHVDLARDKAQQVVDSSPTNDAFYDKALSLLQQISNQAALTS